MFFGVGRAGGLNSERLPENDTTGFRVLLFDFFVDPLLAFVDDASSPCEAFVKT